MPIFLDGAHNVAGAEQLAKFLRIDNKNTWLIICMLNHKNIVLFLRSLKNCIAGAVG